MPHNTVLCLMHVCILGGFKSTILYSTVAIVWCEKKILNYIQKFRNVGLEIFVNSQSWKSQVAPDILKLWCRLNRWENRKVVCSLKKSLDKIYNYTFGFKPCPFGLRKWLDLVVVIFFKNAKKITSVSWSSRCNFFCKKYLCSENHKFRFIYFWTCDFH